MPSMQVPKGHFYRMTPYGAPVMAGEGFPPGLPGLCPRPTSVTSRPQVTVLPTPSPHSTAELSIRASPLRTDLPWIMEPSSSVCTLSATRMSHHAIRALPRWAPSPLALKRVRECAVARWWRALRGL